MDEAVKMGIRHGYDGPYPHDVIDPRPSKAWPMQAADCWVCEEYEELMEQLVGQNSSKVRWWE